MLGMKDDYEYDAEGDVKMSVPQPIFEVTRAPSLKVWSQSAITTFLRESVNTVSRRRLCITHKGNLCMYVLQYRMFTNK
ncbi:hypothetical protein DVH05_000904 [Phytophthora capsici]|nr:hypothetical protein DVH05_000904 [Phytophthora capsici]